MLAAQGDVKDRRLQALDRAEQRGGVSVPPRCIVSAEASRTRRRCGVMRIVKRASSFEGRMVVSLAYLTISREFPWFCLR